MVSLMMLKEGSIMVDGSIIAIWWLIATANVMPDQAAENDAQ